MDDPKKGDTVMDLKKGDTVRSTYMGVPFGTTGTVLDVATKELTARIAWNDGSSGQVCTTAWTPFANFEVVKQKSPPRTKP